MTRWIALTFVLTACAFDPGGVPLSLTDADPQAPDGPQADASPADVAFDASPSCGGPCTSPVACLVSSCNPESNMCETEDACSNGATCNMNTGLCDGVIVFVQGRNGYSDAVDTYVNEAAPDTNFDTSPALSWDLQEGNSDNSATSTLIRFDNLFGAAAIPNGANIVSATLRLSVTDASTNSPMGASLHEAAAPWPASVTWNTLGATPGVQGVEDLGLFVTLVNSCSNAPCTIDIDVTSSITLWSAGAANNGWIIVPGSTSGVDAVASNATGSQSFNRPVLSVTYTVAP